MQPKELLALAGSLGIIVVLPIEEPAVAPDEGHGFGKSVGRCKHSAHDLEADAIQVGGVRYLGRVAVNVDGLPEGLRSLVQGQDAQAL